MSAACPSLMRCDIVIGHISAELRKQTPGHTPSIPNRFAVNHGISASIYLSPFTLFAVKQPSYVVKA